MHIHIALLQWKDGVDRARVEEVFDYLRGVTDKVEGIEAIYCGANTNEEWSKGYTDAVVVVAQSAQDIQAYLTHELHDRAVDILKEIQFDGLGADFVD